MRHSIAAACLLVLSTSLIADELRGKVVGISDGDTIVVLDANRVQHKIRLQGIDAPESSQAFGQKSKAALGEKIHEKDVVVKWTKKDRYDRMLGEVFFGKRFINLEMVKDGWAWHYKQYSSSPELAAAENAARSAKRGLWADPNPTPPWDYRKQNPR